ncbi:hypothetical protein AB0M54_07690 [Actinoplanes sp. NPDC051470]|uniref:hypothetical protein n=1 Tax=unclassified Actinoplanes TaxID=2626549 RepID=UPI003435FD52
MTTQRLIIAAGWLAAAVLAVLVGLVAISVIGDGLTGSVGRPLPESEVARRLAAEPPGSTPPSLVPSPPPSVVPPASDNSTFRTPGGTVVARCVDGAPEIVSMSPGQGWNLHEMGRAEGEFRGVSDNHDRVKVRIGCDGDTPDIDIEERDD